MAKDPDEREPGYDSGYQPPGWWMKLFREHAKDHKHDELAAEASRKVGRAKPWDGSRITKFKQGQHQTLKLVIGLSMALEITPPIFEPEDGNEAGAMKRWLDDRRAAQRDAAKRHTPDGVLVEKLVDVKKGLTMIEEDVAGLAQDHTKAVTSPHASDVGRSKGSRGSGAGAGESGSRRTRRATRRG